jgi:hypothetical protein
MAELLVRTVDKSSTDPVEDRMLSKRGDVIVAEPDDHPWGAQELTAEYWTIIKAPGVSVSEFSDLLVPQLVNDVTVRRRVRGINLDDPKLSALLSTTNTLTSETINVLYNARFDKPAVQIPVILN